MRPWQKKIHEVIFEADTKSGKFFDVSLLILIILSVIVVMLESVDSLDDKYSEALYALEWVFTIIFTIEYFLRIISTGKPWKYMISFFGLVDLLSILPTYIALYFAGSSSLLIIRTLRLLRVFRVFKLVRFIGEAQHLMQALRSSVYKVTVFLVTVLICVTIMGAIMYLIEGEQSGFSSIPKSIYWAVVTITTVGYGDIVPITVLGQFISSILMVMGYGIIAVPTGIVTVELAQATKENITTQACLDCSAEGHSYDAQYCKFCGSALG